MNRESTWLYSIIQRVARRLDEGAHPLVENEILEILENEIELAYPLLDILLRSAKTVPYETSAKDQACLLLICEILSYIHYAIEQNRDWARDFSVQFQQYIAKEAFLPEVAGNILQNLLDILHQNELPLVDAIREANARLIECTQDDDNVIEPENITELLEEIAKVGSECEFEMYENLVSQTYQIIPVEVQLIMISEMVHAHHEVINNAAILMLMHPEPVIRQRTAQMLLQCPNSVTPRSLRRLIVMRNWLPLNERAAVDKIIKNARKANIDCESWPTASIAKIIATGFDGVGAQSILILSKQDKKYHLCGLLLKESMGIREPLMFKTQRRVDSEKIMREMAGEASSITVNLAYLNQAVSHFLSINVARGTPPSPLLLNLTELVGIPHWRAQSIDETQILSKMMDEVSSKKVSDEAIHKILTGSKSWVDKKNFAVSWFEQDAEVDSILENILQTEANPEEPIDINTLIDSVCEKILQPRRVKWRNRLLWMSLWARSNVNKKGPNWKEFLILARSLSGEDDIKKIPLMKAISKETILIALKSFELV